MLNIILAFPILSLHFFKLYLEPYSYSFLVVIGHRRMSICSKNGRSCEIMAKLILIRPTFSNKGVTPSQPYKFSFVAFILILHHTLQTPQQTLGMWSRLSFIHSVRKKLSSFSYYIEEYHLNSCFWYWLCHNTHT